VAETLPLFPLCTVLLPGASQPLHIFEPRYRQLTVDLVTGAVPDREFGVIGVLPGWNTDVCRVDQVERIGCSAVLREARKLGDGRFNIVTRGERRFRLLEIDTERAPYLMASVEWLPDSEVGGTFLAAMPELAMAALAAHRRYCTAAWHSDEWVELAGDTEPKALANLVAADCLLPVPDRQRLLEERCPAKRLQLVRRMLNREAGIVSNLHAVPTSLSELGPTNSLN
jgi:uncharacterized protein